MLGFRRLRSRILSFVLGLFALIQGITFFAVNAANWRSVNQQIESELLVSGRVFDRFFGSQEEQFILDARLLSGDFAFKQAYADGDRETLLSAVRNLQRNRIGADLMMLTDAEDYTIIIDTLHPQRHDVAYPFPQLVEAAEETGAPTAALEIIDQRLHRLVLVPLLAPEPVAWITVGFEVDDELARELKQLTLTDVSFLIERAPGDWSALASTLSPRLREALAAQVDRPGGDAGGRFTWSLDDEHFLALGIGLGERFAVVLQRSLEQALAPFEKLYRTLVLLTFSVLVLSALGAMLIARSVTRPVTELVRGIRQIEQGDYRHQIRVGQKDELGRLAEAFNHMARGLAAFQRYLPLDLIRTLIAQGIESRPETRMATILFVDIEDFTRVAEQLSPERTVAMLNDYFSAVTPPIERNGGVITQFQGDAILAVFNVPTDDPLHAQHAVHAAREIHALVSQRRFAGVELRNRIGINTGEVVAGSVGSENRVNYTVHGDAVNLAARLEVLNKDYGTRVLASQATINMLDDCANVERIGAISIRGKQSTVTVYKLA